MLNDKDIIGGAGTRPVKPFEPVKASLPAKTKKLTESERIQAQIENAIKELEIKQAALRKAEATEQEARDKNAIRDGNLLVKNGFVFTGELAECNDLIGKNPKPSNAEENASKAVKTAEEALKEARANEREVKAAEKVKREARFVKALKLRLKKVNKFEDKVSIFNSLLK